VYTSSLVVHSDTGGRRVDESFRFAGDHLSEYHRTKWQAHYEVAIPMMEAGLPLVVVQPGLVYGPGDHSAVACMFEMFLRGRLPAVPGRAKHSWAHVDDIADAHIAALERGRPGECYHLAGPDHSFRDVFRAAARITGRRPPPFEIPPVLMKALVPIAAAAERFTGLPEPFRAESLRVSAGTTYISSSNKAEREFGFDPRPIEIGLRDTLADIARRISGAEAFIGRRFDRRAVRSHRQN
ncbi:MAG: NAD-dependent epimerase/dehydratase family protein, partial [Rhodothermales bacterium]|nr:NAD-dependent epimerase/dehydratase family protein [Rhodothermales bacterium]